jgi:hypothetical protein
MSAAYPRTDAELRQWIRDGGGIRRDVAYTDSGLTGHETRRTFGYLDRNAGEDMDALAAEVGESMPWFGIADSDSLMEWLDGDAGRDYLAEYERATEPEPDPIEWQWIDQAERMARAMRAAIGGVL